MMTSPLPAMAKYFTPEPMVVAAPSARVFHWSETVPWAWFEHDDVAVAGDGDRIDVPRLDLRGVAHHGRVFH